MDELGNTISGRLHHIRRPDIQLCTVCKKSVRVKLCDLHHCLVLALCTFQHLILPGVRIGRKVSHIRDIHDTLHIIAHIAQCFLQNILHNIASQIPDMRIMVNRGAAGIHGHFSVRIGDKKLLLSA